MLRFWMLIGLLFAVCVILVNGARMISRLWPPPSVYLDAGSCEQPCWQGIQPGVITTAAFDSPATTAVVLQTPYRINRAASYGGDRIMNFELSTRGQITLGEVIRVWGAPERIGYLGLDYSRMGTSREPAVSAQFYFFDGLVVVQAFGSGERPRLSPDMAVYAITYYAPGEPTYPIGKTARWHSLASISRYRTIFEN
jgi:hypothetical protein